MNTRHLLAVLTSVAALAASTPSSAQELVPQVQITFDTDIANGGGTLNDTHWRPNNVVAVWITQGDALVKTVFQSSSAYEIHLLNFRAQVPATDLDGVSGATRLNHDLPVVANWDLSNSLGEPVLPGIYTVHAEINDCNAADGVLDCGPYYASFDYELVTDPIEDATPVPQIFTAIETGNPPAGTIPLDNAATQYQLVEPPPPEEDIPGDEVGGPDNDGETNELADGRDPTVVGGCSAVGSGMQSWGLALLALLFFGIRRRRFA